MKTYFFTYLTLVLLLFSSHAQKKSGKVIYEIKNNIIQNLDNESNFKKIEHTKKEIEKIISTLEFELIFNQRESIFKLVKKLNLDGDEFHSKIAILFTQGNKIFYTNKEKETILKQASFLDKNFIIEQNYNDKNWMLTKEQKMIGDFLCFKALYFEVEKIETSKGIIKKDRKYVVWYCPKLPYNFGPYDISGLPGLVLEYSNNKLIYTAREIILEDKSIVIEPLFEGEIISQNDFNNLGKKASGN